jgi:hypothetical protein
MNARERRQLEIKLQNREAELNAQLCAFRRLHPICKQSDVDFEDGKFILEELDLMSNLAVEFAQSVMASAASVSTSRDAFEVGKSAIVRAKERLLLHTKDLATLLSRLQPAKEHGQANNRASQNIKMVVGQIDRMLAEAEFDFVARATRSGQRPTDDMIDGAIQSCASRNMDKAYRAISQLEEFRSLTRDVFRERWRISRGNPQRGRPRSDMRRS